MNTTDCITDRRDVEYVRHNFVTFEDACARAAVDVPAAEALIDRGEMPQPSYVLAGGERYVPADYFENAPTRESFIERYLTEARRWQVDDSVDCASAAWNDYLTGVYGVCLKHATPENIVRKAELIERIELLISDPKREDPKWRSDLKLAVDSLDELERPFSPVHDRKAYGRPPTRDTHIVAVRAYFF